MAPRLLTIAIVCAITTKIVSALSFGLPDPSVVERNAISSSSFRRRHFLQTAAAAAAAITATPFRVSTAYAEETTLVPVDVAAVPMKRFVDNANPSYFVIDVPQRFFTIRRSAKGDLPDAKTGQGRRGGTIFTAGDMSKAEVVAVER